MRKILLVALTTVCSLAAFAQWGSEKDGVAIMPEGVEFYDNQMVMGADGTTWFYCYRPDDGVYKMTIQALDMEGNKKFGEEGLVVSQYDNLSYTEVNRYLYANSDGSVTLVVRDLRDSNDMDRVFTYTAYRIAPDGTQLWGEDGVCLNGDAMTEDAVCMTFCELSDGSTAFAWQHSYGAGKCLEIQKVSKEGECLFNLDDTRLCKENGFFVYPYMVPSDNGCFIIVYGYTSSYYLKAMKFNPDGTQAWASATDIYKGSWGSVMSLQSRMHVYPAPDGGVIVSWNDDRNYDGWYSPYVARIKPDGTSAFTNAEGKPDIRLSYQEYSAYPPHLAITEDYIYAVFSQFSDYAQNWQQLSAQKIDMNTGEILWGDSGVQVRPMMSDKQCCGSEDIQLGADGQMCCFYEEFHDYGNVKNCFSLRNTSDCSPVDEDNPEVIWRSTMHYREYEGSLLSPLDNTWILSWTDDDYSCSVDSQTRNRFFTKMRFDGSEVVVTEGIKEMENSKLKMENSPACNLQGQRVGSSYKGVVVQNGKKLMK